MIVRKYKNSDLKQVVSLISRDLIEANSKDYPTKIDSLVRFYNEDYIRDIMDVTSAYVAEENDDIVGVISIGSWGMEASEVKALFVCPKCHGKGIGTALMDAIKKDEYFLKSKKLMVSSSITAKGFYEKMGFKVSEHKGFDGMFYRMYFENRIKLYHMENLWYNYEI